MENKMNLSIFENKNKLRNTYNNCSYEVQQLFNNLVDLMAPLSSSSHPSNKPDFRFKKGQLIYCAFVLQPRADCIKIEIRVDKLIISSNIFDIKNINDSTRPGLKWIEFKIFNKSQLQEAIKIIKQAYDNFLIDSDKIYSKQDSIVPKEATGEYLPTKTDFESAYKMLCSPGKEIGVGKVLDQIEKNALNSGFNLKLNWRMITERNIKIWSGNA
jgi:hypothetical protein